MTTKPSNQQPDSPAGILRTLTADEVKLLKAVGDSKYGDTSLNLVRLGLLDQNNAKFGYRIGWQAVHFLTELGSQVLAFATSKPEAADEKPDKVISAAQFVRDNYAAKIAAGECKIHDSAGKEVITRLTDVYGCYNLANFFDGEKYHGTLYRPENVLHVTWLTATPPSQPANESGTAIVTENAWGFNFPTNIQQELDDIDRHLDGSVYTSYIRGYINQQAAENTRLRSELEAMTAANQVMREALERISAPVSEEIREHIRKYGANTLIVVENIANIAIEALAKGGE